MKFISHTDFIFFSNHDLYITLGVHQGALPGLWRRRCCFHWHNPHSQMYPRSPFPKVSSAKNDTEGCSEKWASSTTNLQHLVFFLPHPPPALLFRHSQLKVSNISSFLIQVGKGKFTWKFLGSGKKIKGKLLKGKWLPTVCQVFFCEVGKGALLLPHFLPFTLMYFTFPFYLSPLFRPHHPVYLQELLRFILFFAYLLRAFLRREAADPLPSKSLPPILLSLEDHKSDG